MKTNNFNTNTSNNDTWLTPPTLIESLGTFDLDPCSPINRPWDTALKHYTIEDNGLIQQWNGRVWLNFNTFDVCSPIKSKYSYQRLVCENAVDVRLLNHVMWLIFQLKEMDSVRGVTSAYENMHALRWHESVKIQLQPLLLKLRRTNIESQLKAGSPIEDVMLSVIKSVEGQYSSGLQMIGSYANVSLDIDVPIADKRHFLLRIILLLYRALNAPELSTQILFQPVSHAILQREIKVLINSLPPKQLKEYTTILNSSIRLNYKPRVFLNPPYGRELKLWLEKMTEHLNGTALIFARTETEALQRYVFPFAESILFIKGRLKFFSDKWEQAQHNANAPSILISYSEYDAEMIERSGIKGYHQYLRQIFVMQFERDHSSDTWKVIVGKALVRLGKENTLREVYQEVISIAPKKVRNNNNYRAKVRQILQQHFKRVAKATYKV